MHKKQVHTWQPLPQLQYVFLKGRQNIPKGHTNSKANSIAQKRPKRQTVHKLQHRKLKTECKDVNNLFL